jgi:hypothetical protein
VNATNQAFKIDNADQDLLQITIKQDGNNDGTANVFADQADLTGFTSTGVYKTVSLDQTLNTGSEEGSFVIDMKTAGITSLVISDIQDGGATTHRMTTVEVQPLAGVTNAVGTAEVQLIDEYLVANTLLTITLANGVVITDTPASAAETPADTQAGLRADADYATSGVVITVAEGDDGDHHDITLTYAAAAGDVGLATATVVATAIPVIETVEGEDTGAYDFTTDEDAVFDLDTAADTEVELAYGAGDVSVSVTSWVESEAVADYETVDAAYASTTETVTFYDPKGVVVVPRIERSVQTANDELLDLRIAGTIAQFY